MKNKKQPVNFTVHHASIKQPFGIFSADCYKIAREEPIGHSIYEKDWTFVNCRKCKELKDEREK